MNNFKSLLKFFGFLLLLVDFGFLSIFSNPSEVPKEVRALVGTYTGSWQIYGLDSDGKPVVKMTWTDRMEAKDPIVKEGRAYVKTLDEMKFTGGIPVQKIEGIEGYYLNKDGSLGDYFFETFGQVYKMIPLTKHTWVYAMPGNPERLAFLGLVNVITARHVVVKEITHEEGGKEVHRISRVTTVKWKNRDGKVKWKQFVSLKGCHQRQK